MKAPYSTKTEIEAFFNHLGIRAQKKFGQNFLVDQNLVQYILETGKVHLSEKNSCIAEIGIGLGSLTYPILNLQKKTFLFEIDLAYIQLAKEKIVPNFPLAVLFEGDALINLERIESEPVFVFGNLPYHLTTEILTNLTTNFKNWIGGIFMVQKEFAERLVKEISSFSVFLGGLAEIKLLKHVHKNCFYPVPKIHSSLIQILPKKKEDRIFHTKEEIEIWSKLLRSLFWGKRKQIQVSLRESPFSKEKAFQDAVLRALSLTKLEPKLRPEELNQEQFLNLGQHLLDDLSK